MVVYLVSSDISMELPMIVLHLAAQVVDHVIDVLSVAVLVLKEFGNLVNLVPINSFGT